ncbi:hypothetical protein OSJ57_18155 [Sphingomonas sp. HH69]
MNAYAVTAGTAALVAVVMALAARTSRSDALIVGSVVGYLLFALLMLWCFAERRQMRVWLVLAAAALGTHGLAMLIERTLPLAGGPLSARRSIPTIRVAYAWPSTGFILGSAFSWGAALRHFLDRYAGGVRP